MTPLLSIDLLLKQLINTSNCEFDTRVYGNEELDFAMPNLIDILEFKTLTELNDIYFCNRKFDICETIPTQRMEIIDRLYSIEIGKKNQITNILLQNIPKCLCDVVAEYLHFDEWIIRRQVIFQIQQIASHIQQQIATTCNHLIPNVHKVNFGGVEWVHVKGCQPSFFDYQNQYNYYIAGIVTSLTSKEKMHILSIAALIYTNLSELQQKYEQGDYMFLILFARLLNLISEVDYQYYVCNYYYVSVFSSSFRYDAIIFSHLYEVIRDKWNRTWKNTECEDYFLA